MAEITQWDYKLLKSGYDERTRTKLSFYDTQDLAMTLAKLGNEGWEQSGQLADNAGSTHTLIFKRPKQPNQDSGYSR